VHTLFDVLGKKFGENPLLGRVCSVH